MLPKILAVSFITFFLVSDNWKSDPSTAKVNFTVDGPFGTVHGSFSGLKSEIRFDEKDLVHAVISASIDAKTVSTGIGLRNRDLRKKQIWLDTDKYPRISFRSSKIEKTSGGYKAIGTLTLKDVSKTITIPFTFSAKADSGTFKGSFAINREDYNVGKKGGSVGNKITISLEVPVTK